MSWPIAITVGGLTVVALLVLIVTAGILAGVLRRCQMRAAQSLRIRAIRRAQSRPVEQYADPYESAQRLAQQHQAIRRTLADLHADAASDLGARP